MILIIPKIAFIYFVIKKNKIKEKREDKLDRFEASADFYIFIQI